MPSTTLKGSIRNGSAQLSLLLVPRTLGLGVMMGLELLDERLIVLLVGARPRHFDLLCAAPGDDDVVHERAIIVEVGAEK